MLRDRTCATRFWRLTVLLATVAAMLPAAPAVAQSRRNAATWYAEAIEAYEAMPDIDRQFLRDRDRPPRVTPELRRILREMDPILDDVERGSRCRYSDWELNYDDGMGLLLPHLNQLRNVARVLVTRSNVLRSRGQGRAAVADLETVLRVAGHTAEDDVLISSLVGMAIASLAAGEIESGLASGAFAPGDVTHLLDELARYGHPRAFRPVEAVVGERRMFGDWIARELRAHDPEGRERLLTELFQYDIPDDPAGAAAFEALLADESVDPLLNGLDRAYADQIVALDLALEDPEAGTEAFAAMTDELQNGDYGPLAMLLLPSVSKVAEQARRVAGQLETQEAAIRRVIGEPGAGEGLRDAAAWYRVAIEAAAAVDPAHRAALVAGELPPAPVASGDDEEGAAAAWRASVEARGRVALAFARATQEPWVDLRPLRADSDSLVLPAWPAAVRGAHELLLGAVRAAAASGDAARATDHLVAALTVPAHLSLQSDGDAIGAGLVAASMIEALADLVPLVRAADESGWETAYRGRVVAAGSFLFPDIAAGLTRQSGSIPLFVAQSITDLRRRARAEPPMRRSDYGGLNEGLDGEAFAVLLLVAERVAGEGIEALAPPPDERGVLRPAGEMAAAAAAVAAPAVDSASPPEAAPVEERLEDLILIAPGYEGLLDLAALAALERAIPDLRRAIAFETAPLPELLAAHRPFELRDRIGPASRATDALLELIDASADWPALREAAGLRIREARRRR